MSDCAHQLRGQYWRRMIDGREAALINLSHLTLNISKEFGFLGAFIALHRYKGRLEPHLSIYLWKWHLSIGWRWIENNLKESV